MEMDDSRNGGGDELGYFLGEAQKNYPVFHRNLGGSIFGGKWGGRQNFF